MQRFRRVVLQLTVAGAVIPALMWVAILSLQTIASRFGNSGHRVGERYVVRFMHDYHVIKIYRNGFEWVAFGYSNDDIAPLLALYGLICLLIALVEGIIRFAERRNRVRAGFEVIVSKSEPKNQLGKE